jgi:hypothetical protein
VRLHWYKCENDTWCKLNSLNLDHRLFDNTGGVYVIWHGGNQPSAVRIGQGFIERGCAPIVMTRRFRLSVLSLFMSRGPQSPKRTAMAMRRS